MYKLYELNKLKYYELLSMHNSPKKGGSKTTKKWDTLEHNGVMFYPEYVPHNLSIKYNNELIYLNPKAEEYITYYAHPKYSKYKNKRFNKNFFNDWKKLLDPTNKDKIQDFDLIDLTNISNHLEQLKAQKKPTSPEEKHEKELKAQKYKTATVDGIDQAVDNYMVEPPGLFIGRGDHPKSGKIKNRIEPEDIVLNVGPDMPIPVVEFDPSRRWGEIISNNELEWIASWQDNVTNKYKYARFGRGSTFKMKSDESKYDLARLLKRKIKKIRDSNEKYMKSNIPEYRQLATALFLIDRLALRIGNEKRDDEADTVGVTTLKVSNIKIIEPSIIKLDFLGKDSIRYQNKFVVPDQVYSNIKSFIADKPPKDDVFDLITSDSLNKYIKRFMKGLTSKVFRTFNASFLMQIELKKITRNLQDYNEPDKVAKLKYLYDMANLKVAKLCNHQRAVTTSAGDKITKTNESIKKIKNKIVSLKRQKKKLIESNKKTTSINKRISAQQKKLKSIQDKKKLQTESKSLSAGTSKTNYIDPRITMSFLKQNNIFDSIDKFFNKSQQKNFEWAKEADESFIF